MVIYGSSRRNGNTDFLADQMTEGVEVTKVYLQDWNIEPIVDQRHESQGFNDVNDDYEPLLNDFLDHGSIQNILRFCHPCWLPIR